MPCPRSPNLGRRSRANSLELPQSHLQVTSLSSSTNSYQSATVLTWVGALLKPSKDATCSTQPKSGIPPSINLSPVSPSTEVARSHPSPLITHHCLLLIAT